MRARELRSDQLIASEVYTSQEALDAHNDSDIAKEIIPTMISLSAGPPTVHVADVVSGQSRTGTLPTR